MGRGACLVDGVALALPGQRALDDDQDPATREEEAECRHDDEPAHQVRLAVKPPILSSRRGGLRHLSHRYGVIANGRET